MSPRGSKRHPVSPADARAYLSKASAWLQAAEESLQAGRWDVAAGSAVAAGINASDSLSGALLGQRAGGEHAEAVNLLSGEMTEARRPGNSHNSSDTRPRPSTTPPRYRRATRRQPSDWRAVWWSAMRWSTPVAYRRANRTANRSRTDRARRCRQLWFLALKYAPHSTVPRARERNRTADLRITSALLCRLSYSGLWFLPALLAAPDRSASWLDTILDAEPKGAAG